MSEGRILLEKLGNLVTVMDFQPVKGGSIDF